MPNARPGKSANVPHAALVSDERLPFQGHTIWRHFHTGRPRTGHGAEESADRPYLLLEGVEGKIHLLSQNADIQAARRQGKL